MWLQPDDRGYVQVYTGDGKGKTTAAFGLALRASGQGLRVLILQFLKSPGTGEARAATGIPGIKVETVARPVLMAREDEIDDQTRKEWGDRLVIFPPGSPPDWLRTDVARGMERAGAALASSQWDLVILDELNVVLHYGLAETDVVLGILAQKRHGVEIVITGRGAPDQILDHADLVTEMVQRKHYFTSGVPARRGIEF